ncbi:MAG: VCBS repeat-containing protein [Acidobacteriota bacterium]
MPSLRFPLAALALGLLIALPAQAGDWIEFTDETATRIVADSAVSLTDAEEKDFATGDVDRDGDTDLLVARKTPFTNSGGKRNVLFMNEDGVMTDRTSALAPDMLDETDDRDIVLVDLDGDTWLDVVTGTTLGDQPRVYMNLGEDVGGTWLGFDWNAADGRLPTFNPAPQFCALAFGDIDNDGDPDLYFVDYDNTLEDRLLINDGNGFFTDETSVRMTSAMSDSVFGTDAEILDMNGDGWNDIVKTNSSGSQPPPDHQSSLSIIYNDGTGSFNFIDPVYEIAPYMVEARDLNRDGRPDLYIVDDGQDVTLFNTGNNAQGRAEFTTEIIGPSPDTFDFGGNTASADMNLDGNLDIFVADVDTDIPSCKRELTLLRGTGQAPNISFEDPLVGAARPWRQNGTFDIAIFDINGDEVPDLWIGHCQGTKVWMGDSVLNTSLFTEDFDDGTFGGWETIVGGP